MRHSCKLQATGAAWKGVQRSLATCCGISGRRLSRYVSSLCGWCVTKGDTKDFNSGSSGHSTAETNSVVVRHANPPELGWAKSAVNSA